MRLFIAVRFEQNVIDEMEKSALLLKNYCKSGSFSRNENFHITLVFLGEIQPVKVSTITDIMDNCSASPFELKITGFSRFRRNDGDILLRKLEFSPGLSSLQGQLYNGLKAEGFTLENRRFSPHITLARRAVLLPDATLEALSGQTAPICTYIDSFYLMRSDRTGGVLTYTPLHKTMLKKAD